jgi:hypothetical protein
MHFIRETTPIKNYINNDIDNNGYKTNEYNNKSLGCERETMEIMSNENIKKISYKRKKQNFLKAQK